MIQTGTTVRVIDAIAQEWPKELAYLRQSEAFLLGMFNGKVGTVYHLDGFEEMPFLVRFSMSANAPMSTMRFRREELDAL